VNAAKLGHVSKSRLRIRVRKRQKTIFGYRPSIHFFSTLFHDVPGRYLGADLLQEHSK
jgi:hypothetical protein